MRELHRRTGVTNPLVVRTMIDGSVGIAPISPRELLRFQTTSSVLASTKRTAVREAAVASSEPEPAAGLSASLDLTHNFVANSEGFVCAAIFMDMNTWLVAVYPMRSKHSSEFVRVLKQHQAFVRTTFDVELKTVRTDNDPCFTDNQHGPPRNVAGLQEYVDSLPLSRSLRFTHSPPGYQALNPVECAVRQLYHLMNFYLEQGHLSSLCWMDMLEAAAYVMNRQPHPQSAVKRRQVQSPFELTFRKKPDFSDLVAAPGELVVVGYDGYKASAGERTGEQAYYVMPNGAGHIVRSFRTGARRNTKSVRTITDPGEVTSTLVSLRHAIQAGKFREGSGLSGASAAAVASGCLSLLADEVRKGGSDDPDSYFALIDPVSGHPQRLVLARIDGLLARVELDKTKRRGRRSKGGASRDHLSSDEEHTGVHSGGSRSTVRPPPRIVGGGPSSRSRSRSYACVGTASSGRDARAGP